MPGYRALVAEQADSLASAIAAIKAAFVAFPVDREPDEAQTEDDLIYPILAAIDWPRKLWLSQPRASKKGRSDVPDMLLFLTPDDKVRASRESNKGDSYRHGVAVAENKRWQRLLDRRPRNKRRATAADDEVPSTQMLRYLSRAETLSDRRIQWGVLTNGRLWRLYYQGAKSRSEEYVEIDLPAVLGVSGIASDLFAPKPDEREHWLRVFLLLFGHASFVPDAASGRTFHQDALEEGRRWEELVAANISRDVFDVMFPALVAALDAAHPAPVRPRTAEYLAEIKQSALTLLYRLLFILYAEDRDLLPVRDSRYDDYALSNVRDRVARMIDAGDALSSRTGHFYTHFRGLCRIIDEGDPGLGMPPYNGGLFDTATAPVLERIELPDEVFGPILDALSRHKDGTRRLRINYRDLSVQQLGSIYERLLEFELVERDGALEVAGDPSGRKDTGSYYTPEELVRLILERTIGPLLAERLREFEAKAAALKSDRRPVAERLRELALVDPGSRFLDIRVCDPAMGSGHFLVSLVDYLADRVLEAIVAAPVVVPFADADPYVSPLVERIEKIRRRILALAAERKWRVEESQLDDRRLVRRMILKRVVHGVDKNPMAVELAKVALWLHTFTAGAPLSFLDHHLRCGDSLLGAWVRPTSDWLRERGSLLINRYIAPAERAAATMAEIETLTDADIAEVRDSKSKFGAIAERTEPLAALLSLVQAERIMGVFDSAPKKRPESLAKLRANKATPAVIERARRSWAAYEQAEAFQAMLDGSYGDPLQVAQGAVTVAPPDQVEQLALLPEDPPAQSALFDAPSDDPRRRARVQVLVDRARSIAAEQHFLHWEVAFPNVWRNWLSAAPEGGFDAVIGNPPYVRQEMLAAIKPALKHGYAAFDGMADLYVYFYELGLHLLRPGGRLSYVVTNKWLKAGYAEALRGLFAEHAWVELIVDFGHAKQFFRDADVFPCVIVARRPDTSEPPTETEACVIPREDVRPADLVGQVGRAAYTLPRTMFSRPGWTIEPPGVIALMNKIRAAGVPLRDYSGVSPLWGIKTGFNEAYLIDTPTRDALVAADPKCAEIIKPYLRGQDVDRWYAPVSGLHMVVMKSSGDYQWPWADSGDQAEMIFAATFPGLYAHFRRFEAKLKSRQDQGRFWWELRSCAYYDSFERPKILYSDITWKPQFCLDFDARIVNNTIYFLPTADAWIAAVLNAPIGWWYSWRAAQHGKDEALRYLTSFVDAYPVPPGANSVCEEAGRVIERLIAIKLSTSAAFESLADWYRLQLRIEKISVKLREPFALDPDGFVAEIKKALGRKAILSAAAIKVIKDEYVRSILPTRALLADAARLERRISDLVNAAYCLTPEDIKLMWETAPPRMPLAPPPGQEIAAHA
jgi:hypothetical protein